MTIRPRDGCLVKNVTFEVGNTWNEGCEYTCTCSEKLEILCQVCYHDLLVQFRNFGFDEIYLFLQPRCKQLPEAENDKCEVRSHPEDACCKAMYCPDPDAMDNLKPVPDPFEGCIFKNETYNPGQRFFDGCEQQCECMGFSDMVCVSRYVSLLTKLFPILSLKAYVHVLIKICRFGTLYPNSFSLF